MIEASIPVQHEDVSRHYNDLDQLYRSIWGSHLHHGYWISGKEDIETATRQLVQKVAEVGKFQTGEKICDIGCGYGSTGKMLAEKFSAHVNGVTITPRQFEWAKRLKPAQGTLKVFLADWLENRFPSERFHRALAIESSEHVTDKQKFFSEAYRVLKPGATFTVCAWVAAESPFSWEKSLMLVPICNEGRLPALETAKEYGDLFRAGGFELFHQEDISRNVKKTWSKVIGRTFLRLRQEPSEVMAGMRSASGDFLLTPVRMWAAFQTGALRYFIFSGVKR